MLLLGAPVPLSNSANDVMLHQCSDDTRASLILEQLLQIPTTLQLQAGVNGSYPARSPGALFEAGLGAPWVFGARKSILGLTRPNRACCRQFQAPVQGQLASSPTSGPWWWLAPSRAFQYSQLIPVNPREVYCSDEGPLGVPLRVKWLGAGVKRKIDAEHKKTWESEHCPDCCDQAIHHYAIG